MELERKYIHSGQLFVAVRPTIINTVLGSCIAVCLYDAKMQISGMNHYLLPLWNNEGLASPKYGNIAIAKLIEAMEAVGCQRKDMIAKVFGGASPNNFDNSKSLLVGEKNVQIAHHMLNQEKIKIVASDLGGLKGRKISLESNTGKILLKYVQKTQ
nr:chemotaxis protein CheD [uncultured Sulfurimonas sp.]